MQESHRILLSTLAVVMVLLVGVGGMVLIFLLALKSRQPKAAPPPPAPFLPSRTSFLAGMSFLSGLSAIVLVLAAGIVAACRTMG